MLALAIARMPIAIELRVDVSQNLACPVRICLHHWAQGVYRPDPWCLNMWFAAQETEWVGGGRGQQAALLPMTVADDHSVPSNCMANLMPISEKKDDFPAASPWLLNRPWNMPSQSSRNGALQLRYAL